MTTTLHPNDRGTRYLFGKPYHYVLDDGQLRLVAGEEPEEATE